MTLCQNSDRHSNCHTPTGIKKPGYGLSGKCPGYSLNARRRILRAGGAVDKVIAHPSDCLFLTGTLPGSTEAAKRAIAEWSAYAVNLVQSWLGKRIPDKLMIYAWEFQKRGALHLHLTVVCNDKAIATEIIKEWKQQWERVIDNISVKSGIDCWAKSDTYTHANGNKHVLQTDAAMCTKSAAAYLSKYLSKENLNSDYIQQREYHPSRYWGISRSLCALLEDMTETTDVEISRSSEMKATYEDCLSVLESIEGDQYNYKHRESGSLTAIKYTNSEDFERCQDLLTTTITASQRFCFVNGKMVLTSAKTYLAQFLRRYIPMMATTPRLRSLTSWLSQKYMQLAKYLELPVTGDLKALKLMVVLAASLLSTCPRKLMVSTERIKAKTAIKTLEKEINEMTTPMPKKRVQLPLIPVETKPTMIESDPNDDDAVIQSWRTRSDCCNAIRLAASFYARKPKFMDQFRKEHGEEIRLASFTRISPSCTLKTMTLVDLVNRLYSTTSIMNQTASNADSAICVAIVGSIKEVYQSRWLMSQIENGTFPSVIESTKNIKP